MAQIPWRVIERTPITNKAAGRMAARCARDLKKRLGEQQSINTLVPQLIKISESIVEYNEKHEESVAFHQVKAM